MGKKSNAALREEPFNGLNIEVLMEELAQENMITGTVKTFNDDRGWGFIKGADNVDYFVHYRCIKGKGHRTLQPGQRVKFKPAGDEKGRRADDVQVG